MSSEIVRKGTWPILKYTVRVWGYHTVMIDDESGNLLIQSDRGTFSHWWGKPGRETDTLREFLARPTAMSYVEEKLSYGLSRWDGEEAMKKVYEMCTDKWGHIDEWPIEVAEEMEDNTPNSWGEMYHRLFNISEFVEAFDPSQLPGNSRSNPDVRLFIKNVWPSLIEFWQKELEEEKIK